MHRPRSPAIVSCSGAFFMPRAGSLACTAVRLAIIARWAGSEGALEDQRGHRDDRDAAPLGFDCRHTCIELGIVGPTISTGMNASMTVWAECDHMCRVIRAAVA